MSKAKLFAVLGLTVACGHAAMVQITIAGTICTGDTITIMTATLPTGRHSLSCATDPITGKIYCFGGFDTGFLSEIVEYDPASDTLTVMTATLPTARNIASCAANHVTGKIYCFGEHDPEIVNQIVEYDPATDTLVIKTATPPTERVQYACATAPITGKIYCFGGTPDGNTRLNEIFEYDSATDTVTTMTATLPTGKVGLSCAADPITGKIYCFGGFDTGYLSEIVEYDPASDTLTVMTATLPTGRAGPSCVAAPADGKIYCFGGNTPPVVRLDEIIEYDAATDTLVTQGATLPSARVPYCAAGPVTGKVYCFGGSDDDQIGLNQIVEYQPPDGFVVGCEEWDPITQICTIIDADDDGICDVIDTDPLTASNSFSDGTTSGDITDRGDQIITVTDLPPNPSSESGVRVSADPAGGAQRARLSTCQPQPNAKVKIGAGDVFEYTCGSIDIEVITGSLDIEFQADNGGIATLILNENNGLSFDETTFVLTAPESNTETVVVEINGVQIPLEPGETLDGNVSIPTVSEWGIVVMTLLLLTAGTVVLRKPHLKPI